MELIHEMRDGQETSRKIVSRSGRKPLRGRCLDELVGGFNGGWMRSFVGFEIRQYAARVGFVGPVRIEERRSLAIAIVFATQAAGRSGALLVFLRGAALLHRVTLSRYDDELTRCVLQLPVIVMPLIRGIRNEAETIPVRPVYEVLVALHAIRDFDVHAAIVGKLDGRDANEVDGLLERIGADDEALGAVFGSVHDDGNVLVPSEPSVFDGITGGTIGLVMNEDVDLGVPPGPI